jgi:hypothetical protein
MVEDMAATHAGKTGIPACASSSARVIPSLLRKGEHPDDVLERVVSAVMGMAKRCRLKWSETVEIKATRKRILSVPTTTYCSETTTRQQGKSQGGCRARARWRCRHVPGPQLHASLCKEVGNFPSPAPVMKLMATLRSGAGVPVGLRATGNPGGPGHQWVRQRYIDPAPLGNRIIHDPVTGLERVFIPSKVDNNQHIDVEAYKQRLRASGSKELVRAWLDGDWSVTMGAFFDCWEAKRHVVAPFEIPKDWLRFRSGDWGSASPFSFGWWAIVQDDYRQDSGVLPRGCMVRYREWYGTRPGEPNVGLKLHAEEVGKGILEREQGETISYGVLDPSAFKEDGGPSIAERIGTSSGGKVWFRHADNTRVAQRGAMGGWDQMRARLVGDGDGRPMIVTFSTCVDSIRTIPFLQHDPDRPEDVMTDSEDHAGDEWRYACMSRPWVPVREAPKPENVSGYRVVRADVRPGDWLTY